MKAVAVIAIAILILYCAYTGICILLGWDENELRHMQEEIERLNEEIERLQSEAQSSQQTMQEKDGHIADLEADIAPLQESIDSLEQENEALNALVAMAADAIREKPAPQQGCPAAAKPGTPLAGSSSLLPASAAVGAVLLITINLYWARGAGRRSFTTPAVRPDDEHEVWVRMTRQQAAQHARMLRKG
jgi:hypothetical protein